MAIRKTSSTTVANVEFEPYCEWKKDNGSDILIVHLHGFKKDQLRAQVNSLGVIKVSGTRPIDGGLTSRFAKEAKIPQGCNINDIRAKFTNGHLHVTMPKKSPTTSTSLAQVPNVEDALKPKEKPLVANNDEKLRYPGGENGHVFGVGRARGRMQMGMKVNVSLGVAMLVIVGIGVYGSYKCWIDPLCPSDVEDYM